MDLIENEWYTYSDDLMGILGIFKYSNKDDEHVYYHEVVYSHGMYRKTHDWISSIWKFKKASSEELKKYLPIDHPDRDHIILEEAIRRFPKGTEFDNSNLCSDKLLGHLYGKFVSNSTPTYNTSLNKFITITCSNGIDHTIWNKLGWAKIISQASSNKVSNTLFKVGDKVNIPRSKQGQLWYYNNQEELEDYKFDYFIIKDVLNKHVFLRRADKKIFLYNAFYDTDLSLYKDEDKVKDTYNHILDSMPHLIKPIDVLTTSNKEIKHQEPIFTISKTKKRNLNLIIKQ